MRCVHCQYESDHPFKFCPECGQPAEQEREQEARPEASITETRETLPPEPDQAGEIPVMPVRTAYVRDDYNPARDGHDRYRTAQAPAGNSGVDRQMPSTTGTIVMSIINLLCCGFGISMILGFIALVFAIIATSEEHVEEACRKISWSKKLNVIGLVFVVLQVLVLIAFIVAGILGWQTSGSYSDFPLG